MYYSFELVDGRPTLYVQPSDASLNELLFGRNLCCCGQSERYRRLAPLSSPLRHIDMHWEGFTLQATLAIMAYDILIALSGNASDISITQLSARAMPYCPGLGTWSGSQKSTGSAEDEAKCFSERVQLGGESQTVQYSNGSILQSSAYSPNPNFVSKALNESIDNYLQVIYAAVLADTGIWRPNSLFTSMDMFNQTISTSDSVTQIVSQDQGGALSIFLPQGESGDIQTSNAAALRSKIYPAYQLESGTNLLPIPERVRFTNATIASLYSCRSKKRKDPFSLVICKQAFRLLDVGPYILFQLSSSRIFQCSGLSGVLWPWSQQSLPKGEGM